jgi:hypothetical protein
MVQYVLWLIECSHESGRQFAIMFFGLCCSYRTLLEIFDEQVKISVSTFNLGNHRTKVFYVMRPKITAIAKITFLGFV